MIVEKTELNNGDMLDHNEQIADTMGYNPQWWMDISPQDIDKVSEQMDERFERSFS